MFPVFRDLYATISSASTQSESYWVGDADTFSMQIIGSPSTTSLQGSNMDGRASSLTEANWSHITVVGQGIYTVSPGVRWIRFLRSETSNAFIALRNKTF